MWYQRVWFPDAWRYESRASRSCHVNRNVRGSISVSIIFCYFRIAKTVFVSIWKTTSCWWARLANGWRQTVDCLCTYSHSHIIRITLNRETPAIGWQLTSSLAVIIIINWKYYRYFQLIDTNKRYNACCESIVPISTWFVIVGSLESKW